MPPAISGTDTHQSMTRKAIHHTVCTCTDVQSQSWEPSENLTGCDKILHKLWKEIGKKRKYEVGIHEASKEWISESNCRLSLAKIHRQSNNLEETQRERFQRSKKTEVCAAVFNIVLLYQMSIV